MQNHQAALRYEASLTHTQKLAAAQNAKELAQARLDALQAECKALPSELELEQKLSALRQLRSQRDDVQMLSQMLPGAPQKPAEEAFSVEAAKADYEAYTALNKKAAPLPYILAAVLFVIGAGLLLLPMPWLFAAAIPVLAGFALIFSAISKKRKQKGTLQKLLAKYPGILPENWIANAQNKANIRLRYEADLRSYEQQTQSIRQQMQALKERTDGLTDGMSLADFEHQLLQARQRRNALTDAHRELQSADALLAALNANHQAVAPPTEPDTLTYTAQETARLLSDAAVNRSQLQQRLGQCQGQMASLEQEELLSVQFDKVSDRINQLEQVYSAVVMAQEYLGKATLELQQRFAPRISQRAQATMARLTDGRYDRLYLKSNLTLDTGTRGEVPLHAPLWRSEGTIDQLYFALRLAIADELTADAPLILDDAFVRFDDVRLQKALLLLKEESENKQVLIFTCQGRENRLLSAQ